MKRAPPPVRAAPFRGCAAGTAEALRLLDLSEARLDCGLAQPVRVAAPFLLRSPPHLFPASSLSRRFDAGRSGSISESLGRNRSDRRLAENRIPGLDQPGQARRCIDRKDRDGLPNRAMRGLCRSAKLLLSDRPFVYRVGDLAHGPRKRLAQLDFVVLADQDQSEAARPEIAADLA